jgi:hypothetical protein
VSYTKVILARRLRGKKLKESPQPIFEVFTAVLMKTLLLGFDFPTAVLRVVPRRTEYSFIIASNWMRFEVGTF